MSVPKPASSCGLEFRDLPPLPVSRYGQENASYLDASDSVTMHASDCGLTVCDRHNMLCDTYVWACVKGCLQCDGCGMSVWLCVGSEVNCAFFRFYEEFHERDLSTIVRHFEGQPLP